MEEKKTIFDYIGQVFCIFGFNMACMFCFTKLFGESAKEISALFSLGNKGIPANTMLQFFGISIFIVFFRYLFFTDTMIKNLSLVNRTIFMILSILLVMIIANVLFSWFPVNYWAAWIMFLICFFICFIVSVKITMIKEKIENKKLADGLAKMQREWENKDERNTSSTNEFNSIKAGREDKDGK